MICGSLGLFSSIASLLLVVDYLVLAKWENGSTVRLMKWHHEQPGKD
jgi:hypothetical protein